MVQLLTFSYWSPKEIGHIVKTLFVIVAMLSLTYGDCLNHNFYVLNFSP